ncbi:hypothetical protein BT96DRAFT_291084 [Gymnopus androsaceus JB14]|uniref:Uncharacterized protein n=1 Tax=Gymnopus androsaceus JB14 TaxID=1447944 RepID=A0A6A4GA88_9AGAR|nr:hypothetical protein BT96DRAFT_291084 [Gymnopus androsaceus JB14]
MLILTLVEDGSINGPCQYPMPQIAKQSTESARMPWTGIHFSQTGDSLATTDEAECQGSLPCMAYKNIRHMLLDIVDYIEPVMSIVGSRGFGQLKGILLGSTSHYLHLKMLHPCHERSPSDLNVPRGSLLLRMISIVWQPR